MEIDMVSTTALEDEIDDLRRQLTETKDRIMQLAESRAELVEQRNDLQRKNERLRGASRPFLSLQSPDHSERIAGLIHRTYFDNLRTVLAQSEEKESSRHVGAVDTGLTHKEE